ncbi:MAG: glycosyltransferase family 2 protein [Candidatus Omnitrophica bacterium]|nr:glycosyltransferase family 2 protein [Candidatus Omnitrophota bacterium]
MKISIVVPAHNEEENIADVIQQIETAIDLDHELVVVNDHSSDATPTIVTGLMQRYPRLRLVHNTEPGGFANAIKAGLKNMRGDLVVPVMGDLCDDLATIKEMYAKILEGYDVVCGSRYFGGGERRGGSKFKGMLSSCAGWSLHMLLGIATHDIANAFKMYRKEVIQSITIESKGFEISMELPVKAYCLGFKITEVPTIWKERTKGKSSFKVLQLLPSYFKLYVWVLWKKVFGGSGKRCVKQ